MFLAEEMRSEICVITANKYYTQLGLEVKPAKYILLSFWKITAWDTQKYFHNLIPVIYNSPWVSYISSN